MASIPIQPGNVVGGRYRVDRVLGVGPMSVVVAATHLEIDRGVAIKFLNADGMPEVDLAERFRREAQTAAKVRSEHVVRVLDVGALESGIPYMVMDLVDGRSLKDELDARGPLPIEEAVGHVLQAIEGLAEAHRAGIVHRDVKPANLLLADCAGVQVVKVLDFGVSKCLSDAEGVLGLTRTGMVIGSPLYMAPEQLQSPKDVDARADVWGLGVVLFELLTGHVPYETHSLPELCTMLLSEPPTPITRYRSDVPAALEAVIDRCLRRDPKDRFQHVGELGMALAPFAPPRSHVHAERACRLLDASASHVSVSASGVVLAFASSSATGAPPSPSEGRSEPRLRHFRLLADAAFAIVLAIGVATAPVGDDIVSTTSARATESVALAVESSSPARLVSEPSPAETTTNVTQDTPATPAAPSAQVPPAPVAGAAATPGDARPVSAQARPPTSLPARPAAPNARQGAPRGPADRALTSSAYSLPDFGGRK